MPVSVDDSPFPQATGKTWTLRVPQARILMLLMPSDPTSQSTEWPILNRVNLSLKAGYTAISGTINRVLHGIRAGSSSGPAQKGLLELGLIEQFELDIDGMSETNYRITQDGVSAYRQFVDSGGVIPELKSAKSCTNERYTK